MKTLIIYAHPETEGFSSETLKFVEQELKEKNHEYEVMDLYKMNYSPVLQKEEHYTTGNRDISAQNLEIQNKIKEAKNLIFIYPVWWSDMPAILKGFFDRILTPRFAYIYEKGMPQKLLKDKKAVVFLSSGSPRLFFLFLNIPKIIIKRRILGFCGIKTKVVQFYNARRIDEKRSNEIQNKVKKALRYLDFSN